MWEKLIEFLCANSLNDKPMDMGESFSKMGNLFEASSLNQRIVKGKKIYVLVINGKSTVIEPSRRSQLASGIDSIHWEVQRSRYQNKVASHREGRLHGSTNYHQSIERRHGHEQSLSSRGGSTPGDGRRFSSAQTHLSRFVTHRRR
jgi:hypothetical protein